jgi:hypothetical protein
MNQTQIFIVTALSILFVVDVTFFYKFYVRNILGIKNEGAIRPPLNVMANKLNKILLDDELFNSERQTKIQELFTLKNFITVKWFELRYWIWYKRTHTPIKVNISIRYTSVEPTDHRNVVVSTVGKDGKETMIGKATFIGIGTDEDYFKKLWTKQNHNVVERYEPYAKSYESRIKFVTPKMGKCNVCGLEQFIYPDGQCIEMKTCAGKVLPIKEEDDKLE